MRELGRAAGAVGALPVAQRADRIRMECEDVEVPLRAVVVRVRRPRGRVDDVEVDVAAGRPAELDRPVGPRDLPRGVRPRARLPGLPLDLETRPFRADVLHRGDGAILVGVGNSPGQVGDQTGTCGSRRSGESAAYRDEDRGNGEQAPRAEKSGCGSHTFGVGSRANPGYE